MTSGLSFQEVRDDAGLAQVQRLAAEIWPEYYTPIIGSAQVEYMLKNLQSASAVRAQIKEGHKYFLVRLEGNDVGYLAVIPKKTAGELVLSKIYLRASWRGKGYGRQALDFAEDLARELGLQKITLMVSKKNIPAIQFYERTGFTNAGPVFKDIGGGFAMDDFLFVKSV